MLALLAVIALPLGGGDHWHALQYADKPPNQIAFSDKELKISVRASASPLFYRFDETKPLKSIHAEGSLSALPKLPTGKKEGEKGADDLALRFGIVEEGTDRLGWLEKLFAPKWLRQIAELIPERPFGGIQFLTLAQTKPPGETRVHPVSRYFHEEVVATVHEPGAFRWDKVFAEPPKMMGLWIQADGDDTGAEFDVTLTSVLLTTTESATSPR